jgi:uncharacterized protein (DUF305 family)
MDRRRVSVLLAGVVVAASGIWGAVALAADRDTSQSSCVAGQGMHRMLGMRGVHGMHGMTGVMRHARVADEAGYLAMMVEHHREAIRSAHELSRSDRPAMRRFGRGVVRVQSRQVRQMRRWLALWYPDQPAATYHPMMRDLSGLSGNALDRAFLTDMVDHHMAAVMMSQSLLARDLDRHPQVARLARNIRDSQHVEIRQMLRWYDDWFATSVCAGS